MLIQTIVKIPRATTVKKKIFFVKVEDTASNGEVVSTENATEKSAPAKADETTANGTELAGETGSNEADDGPAPKKQKTEVSVCKFTT